MTLLRAWETSVVPMIRLLGLIIGGDMGVLAATSHTQELCHHDDGRRCIEKGIEE